MVLTHISNRVQASRAYFLTVVRETLVIFVISLERERERSLGNLLFFVSRFTDCLTALLYSLLLYKTWTLRQPANYNYYPMNIISQAHLGSSQNSAVFLGKYSITTTEQAGLHSRGNQPYFLLRWANSQVPQSNQVKYFNNGSSLFPINITMGVVTCKLQTMPEASSNLPGWR